MVPSYWFVTKHMAQASAAQTTTSCTIWRTEKTDADVSLLPSLLFLVFRIKYFPAHCGAKHVGERMPLIILYSLL